MDGILIVNKEAGYTSHDVVARLRGILHQKKIGHTGTLDPDATGVLPICLGKATKVCDVLTDRDKIYEAEVMPGITTDTLDISGTVLSKQPVGVTRDGIMTVLSQFTGEITQIPPMYSAVKVNGKKLYEYARAGETIERKPRQVTIHELTLLPGCPEVLHDGDSFRIRVHCSKGTYIRTLCDDIGRTLGCGAVMKSLVRTAVGRFTIGEAKTLAQIETELAGAQGNSTENDGDSACAPLVTPIDSVFDAYAPVVVTEAGYKLLENGNPLPDRFVSAEKVINDGDIVRVYYEDGFYALYRYQAAGRRYRIEKNFH